MKYDFETLIPRKNMGSRKWNVMAQHNPNAAEDVIPLSVADMEFRNPPEPVSYTHLDVYKRQVLEG